MQTRRINMYVRCFIPMKVGAEDAANGRRFDMVVGLGASSMVFDVVDLFTREASRRGDRCASLRSDLRLSESQCWSRLQTCRFHQAWLVWLRHAHGVFGAFELNHARTPAGNPPLPVGGERPEGVRRNDAQSFAALDHSPC